MSPIFTTLALLGEKERRRLDVNALSRQDSELLIYNKTTEKFRKETASNVIVC